MTCCVRLTVIKVVTSGILDWVGESSKKYRYRNVDIYMHSCTGIQSRYIGHRIGVILHQNWGIIDIRLGCSSRAREGMRSAVR